MKLLSLHSIYFAAKIETFHPSALTNKKCKGTPRNGIAPSTSKEAHPTEAAVGAIALNLPLVEPGILSLFVTYMVGASRR
jgi:hypothetical protein